jgi:hypothetical protein
MKESEATAHHRVWLVLLEISGGVEIDSIWSTAEFGQARADMLNASSETSDRYVCRPWTLNAPHTRPW